MDTAFDLKGKKIVLGVSGGIAAFKAVLLLRLLKKSGAEVQVVLSQKALDFVSLLTFSALAEKKALVEMSENGEWNNHVEIGLWADLMIVYPASANTLAKMAMGLCDNLLMAVYLSARCPVVVCPAMDLDMFAHPSTQNNLKTLQHFGNHILEPNAGELASGLEGKGRLKEPEEVMVFIHSFFSEKKDLLGKKVLITAGPTQEALDPVRFISNHSSGKMGYAIAEEFAKRGAEVTLVSGPTQLNISENIFKLLAVKSANEMLEACLTHAKETDIFVFSAAVADYSPAIYSEQKIKKSDEDMVIKLKRNPDIASTICHKKKKNQFALGFALETNDEIQNAVRKLKNKNFDAVVLNSLKTKGAGFAFDTNKITIFDHNGFVLESDLQQKSEIAKIIVDFVADSVQQQQMS